MRKLNSIAQRAARQEDRLRGFLAASPAPDHWAMSMLRPALTSALVVLSAVAPAGPAQAEQTCPQLRWTTLGTAAGPNRSEPANLLIAGNQQNLVDTGDGTVNQFARVGHDLGKVRTVFLSHHHMDHTGGLATVIGLRWMNNMPG